MCRSLRLGGEDVPHNSILVDDEADSTRNKSKGLLDTIRFSDRSIRIAKKYEGEPVLTRKSLMRFLAVVAYSDDLSSEVLEFLV